MTESGRKRHLLITGPGRSGTTFLVELFDALGFETRVNRAGYDENANAGLEWSLTDADPPYVVKNPKASRRLRRWIEAGVLEPGDLDLVVVAVRDLSQVAQSRADVSDRGRRTGAPGGLDNVRWARSQDAELARQVATLMLTLAEFEIPHVLLAYPRSVQEWSYCYRVLRPALNGIDEAAFETAWRATVRPELVHRYPSGPPSRLQSLRIYVRDLPARVRRRLRRN